MVRSVDLHQFPKTSRRSRIWRAGDSLTTRFGFQISSSIMIRRTLSRDICNPCTSTNFSCARVGPKSSYRSLIRSNACCVIQHPNGDCSVYPAVRLLTLCSFLAIGSPERFTCRRLIPSSWAASFCNNRLSFSLCITSSRVISWLLIVSNLSILRSLQMGHFNFAERGHYHFALTILFSALTLAHVFCYTAQSIIICAVW